jgi:glycosyltransferase involved in cell wall biosynthesis
MISVITSSIARDSLKCAIAGVNAQTYIDHEHIVEYGEAMTGCQSISKCRNAAAQKSQGDWLAILDDDDVWLPEHLQSASAYFDTHDAIMLAHDGFRVNRIDDIKHYLSSGFGFPGSGVVVRKSAFLEVGGFNESLKHSEVWELLLKLTDYRMAYHAIPTWKRGFDRGYHAGQVANQNQMILDRKQMAIDYAASKN